MTRDEIEDLAAAALLEGKRDAYVSQTVAEAYEVAITVLDVTEPLIRADEREFLAPEVPFARDDLRNELRARVEALPAWDPVSLGDAYVKRDDVLALIDGVLDDQG